MAASIARFAAFDADAQFLAVVTADHRLKVWDARSSTLVFEYQHAAHLTHAFTSLAWGIINEESSKRKRAKEVNNKHLALGLDNGDIVVVSVAKGGVRSQLTSAHSGPVRGFVFRKDGLTGFSCADDGNVIEWDLIHGTEISRWSADKKALSALSLNAEETQLATAGHQIKLWDIASKKLVRKLTGHATTINSMRFIYSPTSPVSGFFASHADQERYVNVWDGREDSDNAEALSALVLEAQPTSIEVATNTFDNDPSAKTYYILAVTEDGCVFLWDTPVKTTKARKAGQRSLTPQSSYKLVNNSTKSATVIPVLAATFVQGSANSTVSILIARGQIQKPIFEQLPVTDAATGALLKGEFVLERSGESSGVLLDDKAVRVGTQQHAHSTSLGSMMDGVTVLGPSDTGLARPHMPPSEEITLAEKVRQAAAVPVPGRVTKTAIKGSAKRKHPAQTSAAPLQKLVFPSGVPKAISLGNMLAQALHSDDDALLESCLAIQEYAVVQTTVRRMSSHHVIPFLTKIVQLLSHSPNRGVALCLWIRCVLVSHTAYLTSVPNLLEHLGSLYQLVDSRLSVFKRLLNLSGRLDLVMQQVAIRQAQQREVQAVSSSVPPVIYNEGELVEQEEPKQAASTKKKSNKNQRRQTSKFATSPNGHKSADNANATPTNSVHKERAKRALEEFYKSKTASKSNENHVNDDDDVMDEDDDFDEVDDDKRDVVAGVNGTADSNTDDDDDDDAELDELEELRMMMADPDAMPDNNDDDDDGEVKEDVEFKDVLDEDEDFSVRPKKLNGTPRKATPSKQKKTPSPKASQKRPTTPLTPSTPKANGTKRKN